MWEVFEDVAKRLGLSFHEKKGLMSVPVVQGELDGQRVRSAWGDRATTVFADLDPALDLGLEVHTHGFVTLPSLSERVLLGDSNWDDEVVATADDAERAAVLFADDARRAVLGLNATSAGFQVTDQAVAAYVLQLDEAMLVNAFQHAARAAQLLGRARKAVPVAAPIAAHAKALRALARARSLTMEETPLAAAGELRAVRLAVRFQRTGRDAFDMVVRAEPTEGTLGSGLLVRRESLVDRLRTLVGGQDFRTGDAAFDPMFLVRGDEEARVLAALDADVRALLLDLAKRFEAVAMDEGGLSLRGSAARVPADQTATLLEAACSVVEAVARASGAVLRGPYR